MSSLGHNRIRATEMGIFGWAGTLGDPLDLGGCRVSPRVPHPWPHMGTISHSLGLQSGAKLSQFQSLMAQGGPVRPLLSTRPFFPDLVPELSAHKMIIPFHSSHNSSLCIFLMQSCSGSAGAILPNEWEEVHC